MLRCNAWGEVSPLATRSASTYATWASRSPTWLAPVSPVTVTDEHSIVQVLGGEERCHVHHVALESRLEVGSIP